jgi:hypothetical protein
MKLENRILDFIAAVAPWLAPLIPTYYAAYNAYDYLAKGHNWWDVALIVAMALTVEFIGLAGVHTAIQLWNYNRTKNASDDPAPLWLAILAVAFYITIIIIVNAALDYARVARPDALPYVKILAVGLLSLLALNSALIVALRASQNDRLAQVEKRKADRKAVRKVTGKLPGNITVTSEDWRKVSKSEYAFISQASTEEICSRFGVSDRTARNWRKNAQKG